MNRAQYSKFKTLDQVRVERRHVDFKLDIVKDNIDQDIDDISGIFSFEGLLSLLSERMPGLYSAINTGYTVYEVVSSLFRKKR